MVETRPGAVTERHRPLRKVLIVSYYFPPSGGPGVQRVLKFTKYLPEFGWLPLVLTVREDAAFPALDPSLLAEVPPDATVFRSEIREFYDLYRYVTGTGKGASVDIHTVQRRNRGWKEAVARLLRGSLFIPDGRMGWYRPGVALGRRIVAAQRPDVILASGPPFTAHWIGRSLAQETSVPLVLDFRDPWTRATFYPARPGWARRIDERLEAGCVRVAAASLSVNREIRDDLVERTGDAPGKWHVLPNGYDPEDFEGLPVPPRSTRAIAHVGSLFAQRIPWTFLEVFAKWVGEEPSRRDLVRLVFAGRLAPELLARLGEPDLAPFVEDLGYVSHRESLGLMRSVELLLLLTSEDATSRGMLTGKLFEYLGSGTPILALAPVGEAQEILDATGAGWCLRPGDAAGIARFLDRWWTGAEDPGSLLPRSQTAILQYSRRQQAQNLAGVLESVVSG